MTDFCASGNTDAHTTEGAFAKRVRRHVAGRERVYFAVTMPGFEAYCRQELVDLGIDPGRMADHHGGIAFKGRFVDCQRANLYLRTATRILLRVDSFTASNPRRLRRQCAAIPWELFLPAASLPRINVTSRHSRLYHTDLVAGCIRDGLVDRLGTLPDLRETELPQTLFVRLESDRLTLSLDSSGEPLYKRGLKAGPARAPMRESLAAAILLAAGYDPARPLVDPLCGSGSFSLEAAMRVKQIAPGLYRRYAFMEWPVYASRQWDYIRREAESQVRVLEAPRIFAADIDTGACAKLAAAIADGELSDAVRVEVGDFFEARGKRYANGPGLVVINPPYGVRLGSRRQAEDLFDALCTHLVRHFKGWRVALIAPTEALARRVPFARRSVPLPHGGLKPVLTMGRIP